MPDYIRFDIKHFPADIGTCDPAQYFTAHIVLKYLNCYRLVANLGKFTICKLQYMAAVAWGLILEAGWRNSVRT